MENKQENFDKKEECLSVDEKKFDTEYELPQSISESAEKELDIAIEKGDIMSVKVARETIARANEKVNSAAKHRVQHLKVTSDMGSKRQCVFGKLMKNYKKK